MWILSSEWVNKYWLVSESAIDNLIRVEGYIRKSQKSSLDCLHKFTLTL